MLKFKYYALFESNREKIKCVLDYYNMKLSTNLCVIQLLLHSLVISPYYYVYIPSILFWLVLLILRFSSDKGVFENFHFLNKLQVTSDYITYYSNTSRYQVSKENRFCSFFLRFLSLFSLLIILLLSFNRKQWKQVFKLLFHTCSHISIIKLSNCFDLMFFLSSYHLILKFHLIFHITSRYKWTQNSLLVSV